MSPSAPPTRFFQIRESVRSISPNLLRRRFLLENWQWPALIAAVLVSLLAAWASGRLAYGFVPWVLRKGEPEPETAPEEIGPPSPIAVVSPPPDPPVSAPKAEGEDAPPGEEEEEESLDTNNPADPSEPPEAKAWAFASRETVSNLPSGALVMMDRRPLHRLDLRPAPGKAGRRRLPHPDDPLAPRQISKRRRRRLARTARRTKARERSRKIRNK